MKEKVDNVIPKATAKRLPLYYRYLRTLHDQGKNRINSSELSEALQIDSATIRRDFSYFGELGKRGYGYDVEDVMNFFARTLNDDQLTSVALVGVGNLGNALLKYKFYQNNSIRVSAAFDSNPEITGKIVDGVPVYEMKDLKEQIQAQKIDVVILTVPGNAAQSVADKLVDAGVHGILNFTPHRLITPADVIVQSVDLTNELQTLIYFLKKQNEEYLK
ncbi:MAG: redox-sensing transcriptional repressor Rex [Lactobacillales bacterium]|nr:redox-sensing transcriptional repressor Rex [Lactobacillales bacterium]